jgi:sulfoxide reductase heme-binding subunit YedZ
VSQSQALGHGWWLTSRASGVVALALLTASVTLGLLMASRRVRRPGGTLALAARHEQLALAGLMAIAIHGITLLGDPWLHSGLVGIAIPFQLPYRSTFTGLGILAGYLAALLGLSFYARRWIGGRRWRRLHRLTTLVFAMAVVHAVGAGSDAGRAWLQAGIGAAVTVVIVLLGLRIRPRAQPAPTPRRPPAAPRPEGLSGPG